MNFVCATLFILCQIPTGNLNYDYQEKFVHEITNCALQYNSSVYPYDRIPILLVQAQSIQESNWGRSRFAVEGKNYFGIKEYNLTEPHMKAKLKPNANWGLRKYHSMCDSVEDYMNLLSTSYKYEEFQELLLMQWFKNKVDLFALVDTLYNYAENPEYEEEIKKPNKKIGGYVNYEPSEKTAHYMDEPEESVPVKHVMQENHLVRMPKTISTAINNITKEMQMLGKDGKNEFQKYNYASIDKFLGTVNPLAGHFGLIITQDEESCKIITDTQSRPWLNIVYRFILSHKDGDTWQYTPRRTIYCEMKGGQAMGAAQSYALKQFMRSLFLIATGENDDLDNQNQTYNIKKPTKEINKEGKNERRIA